MKDVHAKDISKVVAYLR